MDSLSIEWTLLKNIYEFESLKVSGPGSYRRDINDVLWTIDELKAFYNISDSDLVHYESLLESLLNKGDLLKINIEGTNKYVSRVAETTRLLGHNYEYWYRGRPGIDAIRWLVEDKKIPHRDIPAELFKDRLIKYVKSEIRDGNSTFNLCIAIEKVVMGISRFYSPNDWKKARFSEFQLISAKEMIFSQYLDDYRYKTQILTAGVGSGKTIAFSIGMLVSAVEGILSGEESRRCHLFLYPRKALAQDQFSKLKEYVANIGQRELSIHFEHSNYYRSEGWSVKRGIPRIYGGIEPPPSIIITTLETLNRRLQHPLVIKKLSRYLRRVVLDEIHLIEGITGCNVVRLLDRLRQACSNREILWTGSSATVASPDFHASTVFGVSRNSVRIIEPTSEKLCSVGLVHHVFMRPSGRLSFLGTLVNSTSILIHNRRNGFNRKKKDYPKTIGFADSLDLLGRWNSDFRENERTESVRGRRHPTTDNVFDWSPRQREVPYALRYIHPFSRRIKAVGGSQDTEQYQEITFDVSGICEKCKNGERIFLRICKREELDELGKIVNRNPHKPDDRVKTFFINNPDIFSKDSLDVGTLDLCPYLRAGACFWFSQDTFSIKEIGKTGKWEWENVARSKIFSSKTKSDSELDEDLSEIVFTSTLNEVYDLKGDTSIPIDLVFASPSLEVGVDISNVTESIMFKAIRNVASYRQKVGRIGREENTDVFNANLISLRPVDLHYYRQPRKLTSKARLDPIPLKEYNDSILWSSMYMGVWDYLAQYANLPEAIPTASHGNSLTDFTTRLLETQQHLVEHRADVAIYLSGISRGTLNPNEVIIQQIISQVCDEIHILLTPTEGTINQFGISCLSDIIVNYLKGSKGKRINVPLKTSSRTILNNGKQSYKNLRPQINPILFDLIDEFRTLDLFDEAGWVKVDEINDILKTINDKMEEIEATLELGTETRVLKSLCNRALSDIIYGLEGMLEEGQNPLVISFVEQYEVFKRKYAGKPHYLSYTIQYLPIFKLVKTNRAYTRPPNLYANPYEENVTLYRRSEVEDNVTVSEAMFSYVPGIWTFRLGKYPRKTLVGHVQPSQGGVLTASLSEMESVGSAFEKIYSEAPSPPGFPVGLLNIYMPRKLHLKSLGGKFVYLNRVNRTIVDGDEYVSGGDERDELLDESENKAGRYPRIKIPKSFIERWVHIVPDIGEKILINSTDIDKLIVEDDELYVSEEARAKIHHPIMNSLINSFHWHDTLHVYDYVYSVSRSYSSRDAGNATLMFRDTEGDIGIGTLYETEGVSIELNPKVLEAAVKKIKTDMMEHQEKWLPSFMKACQSTIKKLRLEDGTPISPFILTDIFGVFITSLISDSTLESIYDFSDKLSALIANRKEFFKYAHQYYVGKYLSNLIEEESQISELSERNIEEINKSINELYVFSSELNGKIPNMDENISIWIKNTLLNTFGIVALSALQRLCGSTEKIIGFSVDLNGIKDNEYRIFLYDRTHYGSGSSEVLRKYLHILNIQRHKQTEESRLLPTEDYLALLEQELLQCPQYHTDIDALVKHHQKCEGLKAMGFPELGYISDYSDEVLRVSGKTWESLGIQGREDAWKLPIISLAPGSFASLHRIEVDDVIRATNICWNGCPECVVNLSAIISNAGKEFVDKAVLDEWFKIGRSSTTEYKVVSVEDLYTGKSGVEIGRQSKVCLELLNRKIRSISLPYQIGFELDRSDDSPHASLIVRDDDIEGLRLLDKTVEESAHGIESLGFKRILWYNLMTSAYLDILNLLEKEKKVISMVFYDCRDISFDDVGISPRMMDAIDYYRKASGFQRIENLSDILIWLAKRGFEISLCVDRYQSQERGVREFLSRIRSSGSENIKIFQKQLGGSMHKKALISPIGVIQGSANLTYSGTGRNEEIINYASNGTSEYHEMRVNILDTFHGSKIWNAYEDSD